MRGDRRKFQSMRRRLLSGGAEQRLHARPSGSAHSHRTVTMTATLRSSSGSPSVQKCLIICTSQRPFGLHRVRRKKFEQDSNRHCLVRHQDCRTSPQVPTLTFRIDIKLNQRVLLLHHRKPLRSVSKLAKSEIVATSSHATGAEGEHQDVDKNSRRNSGSGRNVAEPALCRNSEIA